MNCGPSAKSKPFDQDREFRYLRVLSHLNVSQRRFDLMFWFLEKLSLTAKETDLLRILKKAGEEDFRQPLLFLFVE